MRYQFCIAKVLLAVVLAVPLMAQEIETDFPNYSDGSRVMTATPGTQGGGLGAMWNPAGWAAMEGTEVSFFWNDQNFTRKRIDNWGLLMGGHGLGFSMRRNNFLSSVLQRDGTLATKEGRIDDYTIALGGGTREDFWGVSYNWSKGDTDLRPRDNSLAVGNIMRPARFLSIGNAGFVGLTDGDLRGVSDIGIRPSSSHHLTFFGDAVYDKKDNFNSMHWGVGAEAMPLAGIRVGAKLTKPAGFSQDKIISLSLGLTLDHAGFDVVPHYDRDSELLSTSYLVRLGDLAPSVDLDSFIDDENERIVSIGLKGSLTYQTSRWYDPNRHSLRELTDIIERAINDKHVDGVLLNLSGFTGTREMIWELREKLNDLQLADKRVYIYFDRAGMTLYYLASCADYLWIDPQGAIITPGFMMGRTFWKGFMEKLGLGVKEWRYFEYKSAFESLARREMSDADREQRLALLASYYEEWERGIADGRKMGADSLMWMVDSVGFMLPADAAAHGLVDAIGRWDDAVDLLEEFSGNDPDFLEADDIEAERYADQSWGAYPRIALVYAIGDCAMDSGIRGRYTSRLLRSLATNEDVDAVVMRVDSPGGDALPSDLVAEQMTTVSKRKPMIVSQGGVAASGGYWISMNADRIYTSPFSITGSIGVIAGWVWNEGLTDKTGFTFDHVKIGEHADLGYGVRIPLLGVSIPDRDLTEYEQDRVERVMLSLYRDFVGKVATARELDTAYVAEVAEGRVWSGTDAVDNKLADNIGTLEDAIAYAKEAAGIPFSRKIEIVEYPRRGLINWDRIFSSSSPIRLLFGNDKSAGLNPPQFETDYEYSVMKKVGENPGEPLFMIPPEDIPSEDKR